MNQKERSIADAPSLPYPEPAPSLRRGPKAYFLPYPRFLPRSKGIYLYLIMCLASVSQTASV